MPNLGGGQGLQVFCSGMGANILVGEGGGIKLAGKEQGGNPVAFNITSPVPN